MLCRDNTYSVVLSCITEDSIPVSYSRHQSRDFPEMMKRPEHNGAQLLLPPAERKRRREERWRGRSWGGCSFFSFFCNFTLGDFWAKLDSDGRTRGVRSRHGDSQRMTQVGQY